MRHRRLLRTPRRPLAPLRQALQQPLPPRRPSRALRPASRTEHASSIAVTFYNSSFFTLYGYRQKSRVQCCGRVCTKPNCGRLFVSSSRLVHHPLACCESMSESVGLLSPPPRRQSLASAAWDSAFSPGSRRASHATINGHGGIASRKSSVVSSFAPFGNLQEDAVDPEELFVKHTVAEVRAVQRKLKWVLSSCRLTPH
jgi:hypothetical protein